MSFLKAVFAILAYLIAFDVVGVIVSLVFDSLPLRGVSTALFYTVWFVAGVFCGLLSYNKGGGILLKVKEGDWSSAPESGKTGLIIIVTTTLILVGLTALFQTIAWKAGSSSDPYVPDSVPLTFTFFITILLSMIGGHFFLRPKPTQKS
jgi:ABC-type thiamin/hydroxymethylpyrimidine transport system permease subunit